MIAPAMDVSSVTVEELERDPYSIYAALREASPVAYMPCLDVWMVTSCLASRSAAI